MITGNLYLILFTNLKLPILVAGRIVLVVIAVVVVVVVDVVDEFICNKDDGDDGIIIFSFC